MMRRLEPIARAVLAILLLAAVLAIAAAALPAKAQTINPPPPVGGAVGDVMTGAGAGKTQDSGVLLSSLASLGAADVFTAAQTINLNATALTAPLANPALSIACADSVQCGVSLSSFGTSGVLGFYRADATNAAPTVLTAGDTEMNFLFGGYDGSVANATGCQIVPYAIDTFSTTDHTSGIRFNCASPGSTTPQDSVFLAGWGVGIGQSTFTAAAPPNAMLDVEANTTTTTSSDTTTLGSTSATGSIVVATISSSAWPRQGTLQVDSELMSYQYVDTTHLSITARALYGTTGAAHSCSCAIDYARVIVSRSTSVTPDLIVMSNRTSGLGQVAPTPATSAGAVNMAAASAQSVVASPTAPASTSAYKMQGLAGAFTPLRTGRVLITISGTIVAPTGTTVDNGIMYQISYGTGGAPSNAAAVTGTQVGAVQKYTSAIAPTAAADVAVPFSHSVVVTGLTVGTAYWIDEAAESITTVSAMGLSAVSISAVEF
jgi:hypothetical protein